MAKKNKKSPFWSLCVPDFFASKTCAGMDGLQQGAYLLALARSWEWDGLPADPEELRKALRIPKRWWKAYGGAVIAAFSPEAGPEHLPDESDERRPSQTDFVSRLRHPRQEEQRREMSEYQSRRSLAGKAGANKRWQSHKIAMAKNSLPSPSPSLGLKSTPDDGLGKSSENPRSPFKPANEEGKRGTLKAGSRKNEEITYVDLMDGDCFGRHVVPQVIQRKWITAEQEREAWTCRTQALKGADPIGLFIFLMKNPKKRFPSGEQEREAGLAMQQYRARNETERLDP